MNKKELCAAGLVVQTGCNIHISNKNRQFLITDIMYRTILQASGAHGQGDGNLTKRDFNVK